MVRCCEADSVGLLKKLKKKKTSAVAGDNAGDKADPKVKEVKAAAAGAKQVEKDKMAMPPPAVAKATTA